MSDYSGREPCPYRILDDVGGAFAMGAVGGSIWHSIKGFRNSPRGAQLRGGLELCKARAPVVGGNFAVWGGLFACFDCTLAATRHKEDPWNSILAGAATGGTLAIRAGPKAVAKNAAIGGVLLALIEGLTVFITKLTAPAPLKKEDFEQHDPTAPPIQPSLLPPVSMPTYEGMQDFFTSSDSDAGGVEAPQLDLMGDIGSSSETEIESAPARRGGLMGRLFSMAGR